MTTVDGLLVLGLTGFEPADGHHIGTNVMSVENRVFSLRNANSNSNYDIISSNRAMRMGSTTGLLIG